MDEDEEHIPEPEVDEEQLRQERDDFLRAEYEEERSQFIDGVYVFLKTLNNLSIDEQHNKLTDLVKKYESYKENDGDEYLIESLKSRIVNIETQLKDREKIETVVLEGDKSIAEQQAVSYKFKYENSLWAKFNQKSFCNELYGQALFHCVLGTIMDLEIEINADLKILARPSLFLIQNSRSGKGEGMKFVESIFKNLSKNEKALRIERMNKQNDPTLLNRYITRQGRKGTEFIKDKDGEPIVIPGLLSGICNMVWYPEADFLLNPKGKDQQEAVNIHLNLLEYEGWYAKELAGWEGKGTKTSGGLYTLIAVSRPIPDIKRHIIYSGFLQRCLFIPRDVEIKTRKEMIENNTIYSIRANDERELYMEQFKNLTIEFTDIQQFVKENKITIKKEDINKFASEIKNKIFWFMDDVEKEDMFKLNKDMMTDFIAGYQNHLLTLSYHSAVVRMSCYVELSDLEYAFKFMQDSYIMFKQWIGINVQPTYHETMNIVKQQKGVMAMVANYKGKTIPLSEARKFLCIHVPCSKPTAKVILEEYEDEYRSQFTINWIEKTIRFF